MQLSLTACTDDSGRRLDRILRKALRETPLSAIHRLLRQGHILVDGKPARADHRIRTGETITILDGFSPVSSVKLLGEKLMLPGQVPEILYEGEGLLILNKPAGLSVHGKKSLQELVSSYLLPKLPPSLSFRPGPLHRLDRPSSGVIVFSTSLEGARLFSALMRERSIKKHYLTVVEGVIKKAEVWRDELVRNQKLKKTFAAEGEALRVTGKPALTRVTPLKENGNFTLILAEIETGRTHQIRAQAAGRGHALLGDRKYGAKASGGFFLHAWRMEFPRGSFFPGLIEAPLPENFTKMIHELFAGDIQHCLSQL